MQNTQQQIEGMEARKSMYILYFGSTQMRVFHGTHGLSPWLDNMPQGYTLEYTPNHYTPGKLIAYAGPTGTVITKTGSNILLSEAEKGK